MGKHLMERAGHGRRVMGVVLAAMLVMTMAATAAFADAHEDNGIYPPFPGFGDDLVCVPEAVEPGGTVTCTVSGAEGLEELEYYFAVMRPPADWDGGYPWDWDDEGIDWDDEGIDWDDEGDWDEVDWVDEGDDVVTVAADGTAVFSFEISADAREGDWYEVYAFGEGPGESCFVFDFETDTVIGYGAFEDEDEEGFVTYSDQYGSVRYSWDDAYYYCTDDYEGMAFGEVTELQDDGEDVTPTPVTPPTTPAAAPKLPTTGASTLLLAVLGLLALGGGATAVAGSRRLAGRDG